MEILNVVSSIKLSVSRLPQPVIITENVNTIFVLYPVVGVWSVTCTCTDRASEMALS